MSIHISSRVWKFSKQHGTAFIMMLALADQANDDGFCWPGQKAIAERCRCSIKRIQQLTDKLVADGELRVERGGKGPGDTHKYYVICGKGEKISPLRANKSEPKGELSDEKGRTFAAIEPSHIETSSLESSGNGADKPRRTRNPDKPASPFREIQRAYEEACGYPVNWRNGNAIAAKWLAEHNYTPDDVSGCYRFLKADPFWRDKPIHLASIVKQIGHWRHSQTDPNAGKSVWQSALNEVLEMARNGNA